MAALELSETKLNRFLTPPVPTTTRRKHVSGGKNSRTPPPDYDAFLSENDLPSARTQFASSHMKRSASNSRVASYNQTRSLEASRRDLYSDSTDSDEDSTVVSPNETSTSMAEEGRDKESSPLLPAGEIRKQKKKDRLKKLFVNVRIFVLTVLVVTSVAMFAANDELEEEYILTSTTRNKPYEYHMHHERTWYSIKIHLHGPFNDMEYIGPIGNNTNGTNRTISGRRVDMSTLSKDARNCSNFLMICMGNFSEIYSSSSACDIVEMEDFDRHCTSVMLSRDHDQLVTGGHTENSEVKRSLIVRSQEEQDNELHFFVDEDTTSVHFEFAIIGEILSEYGQIVLAALILVLVYILIIFDLVHRTIAALIGSTTVLGVLSMLQKRPTLETAVEWISLETVCLLFGMMVLVAIFSQTGIFDYFAVKAYKLARGKAWPLIALLCFFSAFVSAFLDNVTTVLLLTPVSIRLCQVLNLDPIPILIAEVLFSNIGGTATAIGDPPNVIIISNELIKAQGVTFAEFTLHLFIGILFCMITAYAVLAILYYIVYVGRKGSDHPHLAELKREIAIWERTARLMPVVSLEERAIRDALRTKAAEVKEQLKEAKNMTLRSSVDIWQKNLQELEGRYKITDKILLVKSIAVLSVVIVMFFFSHFIPNVEINLGWIAIIGALVLLLLADVQELESVLHKVEWGTLLFFAGLFVLMEGLGELGLIDFIGNQTVDIIKNVGEDKQMLVAIILILWVSALASSFIDNIPFTQAMIPVVVKMAESSEVCLSLKPLVWTLALGACLGGNGTLIGASANVVCAGLAEQNGYKITFNTFFKMGFPMMIVTTATAMIYLLAVHIGLGWNVESCTYN